MSLIRANRRAGALGRPNDDRGLGHPMMELSPSGVRLLAAPSVLVLALIAWVSLAAAESLGFPTELPLGEIRSVDRDWRPRRCEISDRDKVVCAIEAFIACATFYRRNLCGRVGLYPLLISKHDYYLYGENNFDDPFGPSPGIVQYRLLEFRNLDERYLPSVLLVHLESRTCYRIGPPPDCERWWPGYAILTNLDTTQPNIAEWGTLMPAP